jgi:hypothetical protein
MMKKIVVGCIGWGFLLALVACGGGEGTLSLEVWGEEFIEDKIPASEVEDGWTITMSKFLIVVGDVKLASKDGTKGPSFGDKMLFDLRQKGPHTWLSGGTAPAGTWDAFTYSVVPADASTKKGNASDADLNMMKEKGFSIYFEGTATKGSETKSFAWGFSTSTTYDSCLPQKPALQGGGTTSFQMTIHADHFFYDDLENPEAKVRFDALANADADKDGKITLEELANVKGADFAGLSDYGVGRFSSVTDLRAFVEHLSRTLGHIDGEGHCNVKL